jgi:pentatricopeptide repeat protein
MVFEFNSVSEFKSRIENKDLLISTEIYKQISKAVNDKRKRKKVTAFVAKIKNNIIEFILERDQWVVTLNTCLDVFAQNDMFEECIEIQKLLKQLGHEHDRDKQEERS